MRLITSLLLLTGFAGPAIAHTGDGALLNSLSHQVFGLHHLPFNLLLCVAAIYIFRRWQSSKRTQ